jgi:hypothetical protein
MDGTQDDLRQQQQTLGSNSAVTHPAVTLMKMISLAQVSLAEVLPPETSDYHSACNSEVQGVI